MDTQLPPLLLLLWGAAEALPIEQMFPDEQALASVLTSSFVSTISAAESWTGQGVAVLWEAVGGALAEHASTTCWAAESDQQVLAVIWKIL